MFDQTAQIFPMSPLILCQTAQAYQSDFRNWFLSVAIVLAMMMFLTAFSLGAVIA